MFFSIPWSFHKAVVIFVTKNLVDEGKPVLLVTICKDCACAMNTIATCMIFVVSEVVLLDELNVLVRRIFET